MSSALAPDKYNQKIKSNKNKHNNIANKLQYTHIQLEESDIANKHSLNNEVTSHNIIKKEQSSLCKSVNNLSVDQIILTPIQKVKTTVSKSQSCVSQSISSLII